MTSEERRNREEAVQAWTCASRLSDGRSMRDVADLRSPEVPMLQKDFDALDAWLVDYGNNCDTWDIVTRMEALSWIRSLSGQGGRVVTIDADALRRYFAVKGKGSRGK